MSTSEHIIYAWLQFAGLLVTLLVLKKLHDELGIRRKERDELDRWRAAFALHLRLLSEFPSVGLVLKNVHDRAMGKPWKAKGGDGATPLTELRLELRRLSETARVTAEELVRPAIRRVAKRLMPSVFRTVAPMLDTTASIATASGGTFYLTDPQRSTFTVEDVASALSKLCRFTGQCSTFYSVAQHAVLVSYAVPKEHAFEALHHDDAEAFINDLASPLKRLLPDYLAIEHEVELCVFGRLGISTPLPPCVKQADRVLLATEQRDLMPHTHATGSPVARPLPKRIRAWSPEEAQAAYLRRHRELAALRVNVPITDPAVIGAAMADCE